MSREVRFTPLAADDMVRAFDWYENQRSGVSYDDLVIIDGLVARVAPAM